MEKHLQIHYITPALPRYPKTEKDIIRKQQIKSPN